jgi:hypothetical protein
MKLHALFATLALGALASLTTAPVHAQNTCASFLCMAGKVQGKDNVPGCEAPVEAFFSPTLYIYDEDGGIDWPLTSANRLRFLSTCPGTTGVNSGILTSIIAEYGMRASG